MVVVVDLVLDDAVFVVDYPLAHLLLLDHNQILAQTALMVVVVAVGVYVLAC